MFPATSSDLLAASAVVTANPARLLGIIVNTDGTNAATVTVYDNASAASGVILAKYIVAGSANAAVVPINDGGIVALKGLYCAISGTGAKAIVHYSIG